MRQIVCTELRRVLTFNTHEISMYLCKTPNISYKTKQQWVMIVNDCLFVSDKTRHTEFGLNKVVQFSVIVLFNSWCL